MTNYVLILAGGKGTRLSNTDIPKQFLLINKTPMLMHSINAFKKAKPDAKIYVGLQKEYQKKWQSLCKEYNFKIKHKIYLAGEERLDTVFLGLQSIFKDYNNLEGIVSIHDSARPFINSRFILKILNEFKNLKVRGVIPVQKIKNSILHYQESKYMPSNRNNYLLCQTPQCFMFQDIFTAYKHVMDSKSSTDKLANSVSFNIIHDDFMVFESFFRGQNAKIKLIDGLEYNIKITTNLDYSIGEKIYELCQKFK